MAVSIQDIYTQKDNLESLNFNPVEALNRLKISRGYYATFLYARSIVENDAYDIPIVTYDKKDPKQRIYSSHERIYESLIEQNKYANLKQVGLKLKEYHGFRKNCDYELDITINTYAISSSERFYKECKERMDFFVKHPNLPFSRQKKIIIADKSASGVIKSKLMVL